MESRTLLVTAVAIMACMSVVACSRDVCPKNGHTWDADKDEHGDVRCILRCPKGYVPSGCHVIRPDGGSYNKRVPYCKKEPGVSGKTIAAVGIGIAAVAAAPYALGAAGFTAAGVAVGSVAALLQGSNVAIGSLPYVFSEYWTEKYTGCEPE